MPTLHETIATKFLSELKAAPEFDKAKLDRLKAIIGGKKKPKAEDLVELFSMPVGEQIK